MTKGINVNLGLNLYAIYALNAIVLLCGAFVIQYDIDFGKKLLGLGAIGFIVLGIVDVVLRVERAQIINTKMRYGG